MTTDSPQPTPADLAAEAVGFYVDGVVADVVGGFLRTRRAARERASRPPCLAELVERPEYLALPEE